MLQICHSLTEAHERDLIHRDIKPANIFVCRYGQESDFVKVLDFGLVKSLPAAGKAEQGLTAPDLAGGTPAFMAPEQALSRQDVDRRADIYSLGCVAYWLLTGHAVFESETALEMITHHIRTSPIPPSQKTEIAVPAELNRIVLDCLEKSPDDRPRNAILLAERLAAVETQNKWTPDSATEWWDINGPTELRAEWSGLD
jgi:serine/threonine-protein kinase